MKQETDTIPFGKDKAAVTLSVLVSLMALAMILLTVLRLRPSDFKVPVQYLAYDGSVLQTAHWFSLYGFVIYAIGGAILAIMIARRLYAGSRNFSLAVLGSYLVINVFALFVINAILVLVSRV